MRYRLRLLLVLVVFGPPILAGVWEFEKDSWPLFLAIGVAAYFALALAGGFVLAWLFETALRVIMSQAKGK